MVLEKHTSTPYLLHDISLDTRRFIAYLKDEGALTQRGHTLLSPIVHVGEPGRGQATSPVQRVVGGARRRYHPDGPITLLLLPSHVSVQSWH